MVAWLVSHCITMNHREDYVRQLKQHVDVDVFGECGRRHECQRYSPECEQKLNDEYRFYLALENSNCRDYITEKFLVNGLR